MSHMDESTHLKTQSQSKYDFVKVRVWLGDNFYVFSRYLASRALVSASIPGHDAVRIALEVKKTLVDLGLVDVVQEQFEDYLYKTMIMYGYNDAYIRRYRMMSKFYTLRIPLLIILAGTGCIGKSTLAMKLGERLNLSSVLQTDVVYELLKGLPSNAAGDNSSVGITDDSCDKTILDYQLSCSRVRKGIEGEFYKCLSGGKAMIIEGFHLDPKEMMGLIKNYQTTVSDESINKAIIVPFLLEMKHEDHIEFIMLSSSKLSNDVSLESSKQFLELRMVQQYLQDMANQSESYKSIKIDIHNIENTLDTLHDHVLQIIEHEYNEDQWKLKTSELSL